MQKIIRTRQLSLNELRLARGIQPFENANRVVDIRTPEEYFEFIVAITQDHTIDSKNYDHVLMKTHDDMTPLEIFKHFLAKDSYMPALFSVAETPEGYKRIHAIKEYNDLKPLIHNLTSRGTIQGKYLIKGPTEDLF